VVRWARQGKTGGGSGGGGIHDAEVAKHRTAEAAVTRQEALGLRLGVRADQEVGDDAITRTAGSPVGAPRLCRHASGSLGHRVEGDRHGGQCLPTDRRIREGSEHFRPDDIAGDDRAVEETSSQRGKRRLRMDRIVREDIEQDARVHGGDHRVPKPGRGPRVSSR
jgi:hypothetical protein